MALNFNPFEKDKAAPTPKTTKDKHSHYRVFDDPTQSVVQTEPKATSSSAPVMPPVESISSLAHAEPPTKKDYKGATNGSQNGLQTDYKQITGAPQNGLQTDHKQTTEKSKRTTQRTTQRITTRLQTDHKRTTNYDFSTLVGHERHLLLFVFDECRISGELVTAPVTISKIKEELKTGSGSTAKTIIARLIEKGFIARGKAKTGRGGWMTFRLEREIFQRLLIETDYKRTTNRSQTDDKQATKQTTQRTTEPPSSSSTLLSIKETTTTGDLPSEWKAIDCSLLEPLGFTVTHLRQLFERKNLGPAVIQESIYSFAFDLEANGKGKTLKGSPLNFFMGVLRNGPYTPPVNYEHPEDRQQRLYLEAKEQQRQRRQERLARMEAIEFEEWMEKLSLAERAKLVAPKDFAKPGSTAHTFQLREYFLENVWPDLRGEIAEGGKS